MIEVSRDHDALDRLWVCHPDLELLQQWRDLSPEVHLVNSTSLDALPTARTSSRRTRCSSHRCVNLRQQYWTGGLTTLFHRFDVLCFGWDAQHERQIARLIDMGIDAVYSDFVDAWLPWPRPSRVIPARRPATTATDAPSV